MSGDNLDLDVDLLSQDDSAVLSSHPKASSIKAIDRGSVHRICSGQVVLTLATAAKELVENSLDAGATNIEIRLKEHGSELLEVSDNGSGVQEENFQGLTLKHHTSKLRDFSDLTDVDTFGFRGEALSSLCALSALSIITCHTSVSVGAKLDFDHNGTLIQQTPHPRQPGTTVHLQQLFSTLPVRHKEFQRNIKKEFARMVTVLNAYCIISTRVRISCTNQVGKGKKNIVVQTNGNNNMKENITNIFGPKQMQNLLEFVQHNANEESSAEFGIDMAKQKRNIFNIQGFVSSCEHGQGRAATDRQFFFVNKRPCDLVKVSKIVNEVYHMYNRHQYPFIVLDINIDKDAVDVNVTPDKRQIFLQNEKILFAIIKTSLLRLYESKSGVYEVNQLNSPHSSILSLSSIGKKQEEIASPVLNSIKQSSCTENSSSIRLTSTLSKLKRSFSSAFSKEDLSSENSTSKKAKENSKKGRILDHFSNTKSPQKTSILQFCQTDENKSSCLQSPIRVHSNIDSEATTPENKPGSAGSDVDSGIVTTNGSSQDIIDIASSFESTLSKDPLSQTDSERLEGNADLDLKIKDKENIKKEESDGLDKSINNSAGRDDRKHCAIEISELSAESSLHCDSRAEAHKDHLKEDSVEVIDVNTDHEASENQSRQCEPQFTLTEYDTAETVDRTCHTAAFSVQTLRQKLINKQKQRSQQAEMCRSFRAKICPGDNQSAEEELKREISKDMFENMKIIGQFNLGFIIALLGQDLFIIDQHATDEKYNFEMLQRHTVIQSQKLIQPQTLELTAMNESMLIDNIEIFQKNGFEFTVDEEAQPTERVKLVSLPMSKNWTFGKDDIEELLFMLCDSPGVMCRPSRIRQMFASRACRKSIMIGTAHNKSEMKKLLCHMGEIDQPWNCPHGRPTMRHLINLDMLPK